MATVRTEIWAYREPAWTTANLVGFHVEALDGSIGKIDEASYDVGAGYIIIERGRGSSGRRSCSLPA